VHELLQRFFAAVDGVVVGHGGTVDKHIGDCVMGLFGAPRAHGDDVDRAIRAAQALQVAVADLAAELGLPLGAHVGLAVGEVVAGQTGSAAHSTYTVTGDAVNLAARLADRAAPGEILAAEEVRRAARGRVDAVDAGELRLDGFDRPIRAVRIGPRPLDPRAEPATSFVGRGVELGQLRGLLEACRTSRRGRTVLVRGEAGIGKSRLIGELVASAEGFAAHEALVLDFGVGSGLDAAHELTRGLLGLAPEQDAAARAQAAERAIGEGLVGPDLRAHLLELLDLELPAELRALAAATDEATRTAGRGQVLAALLRGAAAARPRLVRVEDLHWAEPALLALIAELARAARDCPALLFLTSRPEGDPLERGWREIAGDVPLVTIDLGPLAPEEARAFAAGLLGAEAELAERCVARSAGHPLFLEQLARVEAERRTDAVPETIQSLVLARVDRLPERERETLRAAAVLGQRFDLAALRAVAADPGAEAHELVRRGLVRPHGGAFLFAHALIRDSVYSSLLLGRRRELHRRAADWFAASEPVLQAEHLERAGDPAAAEACLRAGRGEAARGRLAVARGLLERGEAVARTPELRCALASELGAALGELGEPGPAIEAFGRALAAAPDETARSRARLGMAGCLRLVDRLDEASLLVGEVLSAARAADDQELLARALHLQGNLLFPLGRIAECRAAHEAALAAAGAVGSAEVAARALGGLGDGFYLEARLRSARDAFARCVALAEAEELAAIRVANLPMRAMLELFLGEPEAARTSALAAVEAATVTGRLRAELIARHVLHILAAARGELEEAARHLDRADAITARLAARRFVPENLAFRAELFRLAGDRAAAMALLRDALERCRATGMAFIGPVVLGGIVVSSDDPQERRSALAEGRALLAAGSACHNHLLFRRDAIDGCLAAGELDEVLAEAAALEASVAAEPVAWAELHARRARALVARQRDGGGPGLGRELAELAELAGRLGLERDGRALAALARTVGPGEASGEAASEAP
jgi:tetratricopeptide (TPR) repeat protein